MMALMNQSTTPVNAQTNKVESHATVVLNDTTPAKADKVERLSIQQLVAEREQWESNAYRTSNEQLYALLQKCYKLYHDISGTSSNAKVRREELDAFIASKGYRFTASTHTITKIVKCVFGADRRRVSTYSIVLRAARSHEISVQFLPEFIHEQGGVEEIRLAKSQTAVTPKQKAQIAESALLEANIGSVKSQHLKQILDAGKVGSNVVLVGTWEASGSITVRTVVQSDTVLNAALVSHYSTVAKDIKQKVSAQLNATTQQSKRDAINAASEFAVAA